MVVLRRMQTPDNFDCGAATSQRHPADSPGREPLTPIVDMTSVVKRALLLELQVTDSMSFSFSSAQQQSRSQ